MKPLFKTLMVVGLGLVTALPAMGAAAPDKAEKVAAQMLKFETALKQTQTQINVTLSAMNALKEEGAGDLVAKYKTFTKEVDALNSMAGKAKKRASDAASKREAYLKQWASSQGQIQNEQLKAASEARRAELTPKIDVIKESLTSARDTFGPFMQDLKDLTLFLGNDLSPQGMTAASGLFEKCNNDGTKVNADIDRGIAGVRDLASSIQPGGPTAK